MQYRKGKSNDSDIIEANNKFNPPVNKLTQSITIQNHANVFVEYADKLPKDNLSRLFSSGFPTTHNSAKWIAKPCPVVLRVCGRERNICSTAKSGAEGSLVSYSPTRMHIEQLVYEITVGCWSAGRTSTTINETLTKIHVHSQRETKQLVKRYFYRNIQTNKKKSCGIWHTLAQPKRELAFRTLQNNFRAAMFLVYWCQKNKK